MRYLLIVLFIVSLESCERERQRQLRDGVHSNQNLSRTWTTQPKVEDPPYPAREDRKPRVEDPPYPARNE